MGFSSVLGHQKQLQTLRLGLQKGRLHHAYLLLGPEGVGKKTVAFCLVQAIHCTEIEGDFCGRCPACVRVRNGNHPDVRMIEPLSGKKEISIQQVREIEKELSYRSFSGRRKVAIIDPAPLMSVPAQNALLKTLEEPPHDSLLILIAASAGGLLPTLRSRCMRLSFGPLPTGVIAEYLIIQRGKPADEAKCLAALAMGSLGAAMQMENGGLLEKRRVWKQMLAALGARDYRGAITTAEAIAADRDESLEFLQWAGSWYRDLLIYALTQSQDEIANIDMIDLIKQESSGVSLEQLLALIAQTLEATGEIQRNLNRRMVIERLLLGAVEAR
jgi:DNA polymerase-3 subunit delta'